MTQVKGKLSKGLATILSLLLIFEMLPGGLLKASAASTLSISQTVGAGGYTQDANGNITIFQNGSYTITGDGSATNGTITVTGCAANVTLENVNIAPKSGCAFELDNGASVNLTLSGANTLDTSGSTSQRAGLSVNAGNTVPISGTGSLTAKGQKCAAGIGGNNKTSCGSVSDLHIPYLKSSAVRSFFSPTVFSLIIPLLRNRLNQWLPKYNGKWVFYKHKKAKYI